MLVSTECPGEGVEEVVEEVCSVPVGKRAIATGPTKDTFTQWVQPHLGPMARLATRLADGSEPDDILQESLTRAWLRLGTYRPARGSPRVWLLAIVADQARRSRRRQHRQALSRPVAARSTSSDDDLDLERAVRGLASRQRLAIELHYFADLSIAESASVMGCAEGTVKSTLADARARLRSLLKESS